MEYNLTGFKKYNVLYYYMTRIGGDIMTANALIDYNEKLDKCYKF